MNSLSSPLCLTSALSPLQGEEILKHLPLALLLLNLEQRIIWLNTTATSLLGSDSLGKMWCDVIRTSYSEENSESVVLHSGRSMYKSSFYLEKMDSMMVLLADFSLDSGRNAIDDHEKRLVSLGTMTAQLAHQIRTPLSSAMLYIEHLSNLKNLEDKAASWIKKIQQCHDSIEQQIHELLLFTRKVEIEPVWTAIDWWCNQLTTQLQPHISTYNAKFKLLNNLKQDKALIHSESLIGAVLNTVINSLQAEATQINLILASGDKSDIKMTIEDNGKGMSKEVRAQALLPFYTTKAQGTGLGLPVVFAVVKAHGGKVTLDSVEGEGTKVCLHL